MRAGMSSRGVRGALRHGARRRVVVIALGATMLAVLALLSLLWLRLSGRDGDGSSRTASPAAVAQPSVDQAPARALAFATRLLPDAGIAAQPASVRIGLAYVSADERAAHLAWLRGGAQGAGARSLSELATVTRWIEAPATADAGGVVTVGPLDLPAADRYVLQARADDGLRFYEAAFTGADAPAEVRPRVAAGLRVRAPRGIAKPGLLLRRIEGGAAADWQTLLQREAPEVLAAYDEQPLLLAGGTTVIAPLPPGPLAVVAVVEGVESERRVLNLSAGRFLDVDLDADAAELGAALATTVDLRLVEKGRGAPVAGAIVTWSSARGERSRRSDASGRLRIDGVDRSQPLPLEIAFAAPATGGGRIATLPRWPERIATSLNFDPATDAVGTSTDTAAVATAGTIARTLELEPLRWLIVATPGIAIARRPRLDEPFPVFVLQRMQDGRWRDAAADRFVPVDEGMAVSLDDTGTVRVAAALAPWHVRYSEAVTISSDAPRGADGIYRARIAPSGGRRMSLRLSAGGRPLASAPAHLLSPLRSVPPRVVTTDGAGRIALEGVTVPTLTLEVPGFAQKTIAVADGVAEVALARDRE